ncbi:related to APA2 - ATP adenylyltransferase II [Melanopsichium pennsylvanicum]|uniref:Related to APA2 - ATP adenylyltransferase II n=1 Tax=Melanopsichium pennsylvanicum TaxID=63383 RepID=A0AAJ4XMC0_9BASI|nr:related to APA2 - ATP adenylyltransferase II [Melanopsichium pennsylvanicum]
MSIADADLKSLTTQVKNKFDIAIEHGDAFFYPSERITLQESEQTGVLWQIRTVPALLKKPKANDSASNDDHTKKQEKPQQNKADVFAPPYVPNLHVKDLGEHTLLLNKFCVVPQHFLMVTREFASQDLPPSPQTLSLAYRIVSAHRATNGTELLAFYNCGATSGASQPHRHLQFVQCPPLDTTSSEAIDSGRLSEADQDKITQTDYKIPVESLLERIEKDGKEQDSVHALPLAWQHFVVLLNPTAQMNKVEPEMERYIGNKFMGLLDALFRARMFASDEQKKKNQQQQQNATRPAFNILITKRAMHLIPRSQEEYTELPGKSTSQGKIGNLSINSLGYAGFMLTRSLEEQDALKSISVGGVEEVLKLTGVPPVQDVTVQTGLPTTNM